MLCHLKNTAQPNGGFENWTNEFGYENPDDWQTLNFLSLSNPPSELSAFKAVGSDKHSGNYALKLKTILVDDDQFPALLGDSVGGAFTGKINFSPFFYKFGYPYTGRPEKIQFWAKYQPVGNDTAAVAVMLRKLNGTLHDTVAFGVMKIAPSPVYTFYQLNLEYNFDILPDTAIIAFYPSGDTSFARINSTLFIDDVLFTGWVGIDESKGLGALKIAPNPAKDYFSVCGATSCTEMSIHIRDISGNLLIRTPLQKADSGVNVSNLPTGLYIYEIYSKNKITARGKLNIVK